MDHIAVEKTLFLPDLFDQVIDSAGECGNLDLQAQDYHEQENYAQRCKSCYCITVHYYHSSCVYSC